MSSNKIYNELLGLIFIPNSMDGPAKIGKKYEVDILNYVPKENYIECEKVFKSFVHGP